MTELLDFQANRPDDDGNVVLGDGTYFHFYYLKILK